MTFHVTAMKSGANQRSTELEPDIHQLLAIVQAIRPISLRTLYRWLEQTNVGAGRVNYSESEVDQIKAHARKQNRSRSFLNYSNRLKNAEIRPNQTIEIESRAV